MRTTRLFFLMFLSGMLCTAPLAHALSMNAQQTQQAGSAHTEHNHAMHHTHDTQQRLGESSHSCPEQHSCDDPCCNKCLHSSMSAGWQPLTASEVARSILRPVVQSLISSALPSGRDRPPRIS